MEKRVIACAYLGRHWVTGRRKKEKEKRFLTGKPCTKNFSEYTPGGISRYQESCNYLFWVIAKKSYTAITRTVGIPVYYAVICNIFRIIRGVMSILRFQNFSFGQWDGIV